MKNSIIFSLTIMFLSFAFTSGDAFSEETADGIFAESAGDILIVLGSATGGAILGLSTLSFVDEPWDHSKNILVGLSIGTIIGVGVVAWTQATKSQQYYEENAKIKMKEFGTFARSHWHNETHRRNRKFKPEIMSYTIKF